MAAGFVVHETFPQAPEQVWACLSDLENAATWMNGIDVALEVGEGAGSAVEYCDRATGAFKAALLRAIRGPERSS